MFIKIFISCKIYIKGVLKNISKKFLINLKFKILGLWKVLWKFNSVFNWKRQSYFGKFYHKLFRSAPSDYDLLHSDQNFLKFCQTLLEFSTPKTKSFCKNGIQKLPIGNEEIFRKYLKNITCTINKKFYTFLALRHL